MATTVLTPAVSLSVSIPETKASLGAGGAGVSAYTHALAKTLALGIGTGANNVDTVYSTRQTITAGTPLDTDLQGSLASVLDGTTVSFPLVVGVLVVNNSSTAGQTLSFGVGANPVTSWMAGTTPTIIIGAGGWLFLAAPVSGYATVAATGDIMRLTSASGSIVTDIVVFGRQS